MKDFLKQLVGASQSVHTQRNVVREYLQSRMLQALQENRIFQNWVFLGGTALRFLYSMRRYSEDLDFSMIDASKDSAFAKTLEAVCNAFLAENYTVDVKLNDKRTVHSAFLNFRGLLYELGLSTQRSESLSIKIELDTNPPEGAGWETTLVRRYVTLNLTHHDRPSLLAGKIHAVLVRPYIKGRDLYDLIWYLADPRWSLPNVPFLNNALRQTGWSGVVLTENNWRKVLLDQLENVNWERAAQDVSPFLESEAECALVTLDNCRKLLRA